MRKGKDKSGQLSVFKGREARLNRAIFHILALKGPQTIYDIHKRVRITRGFQYTKYATVNKRVRALQDSGYIKKTGVEKTKAGFQASIYEPTTKAYLAVLLNMTDLDGILAQIGEDAATVMLAVILDGNLFAPSRQLLRTRKYV